MDAEELLRDRYQILNRLGTGVSGAVYRAIQLSTKQSVAIKLLSVDRVSGESRHRRLERFHREITLCSQLYHPDIVRLLDSGVLDDQTPFAVFEYIPGNTLAELLAEQGMLKVQRAHTLMMQLLAPLTYAHGKGIFHRDLKPSNIMVTTDAGRDRVKILDFGIGIASGAGHLADDRLTLSNEWVGTPMYTAPEQLRGDPPGPKFDLYAWGLIFLECLTGTPVAKGRTITETLQQHSAPEPHPLPTSLQDHRLGTLLSRVLEKNPARRAGDASALLTTLEKVSVEDLEDAQGYLRSPLTRYGRSRTSVVLSDTVTDGRKTAPIERRHATVICCRVSVSGAGDPSKFEELDSLIEDSNALAREVMGQFGASPCESFADYSVSYFGLSRARDADAGLAVRAALEIETRLERSPSWLAARGLALKVHLGIHNGPVTVQFREGTRRQIGGLTTGVAVRLASLVDLAGEPVVGQSAVLVSDDFRRLLSRHTGFTVNDDPVPLPNDWDRSIVHAVYRLVPAPGSGSLLDLRKQSPFVGRRVELGVLGEAWQGALNHEGSAVFITGEAGIGKSRLIREMRGRLQPGTATGLDARCLPEWQSGSLRPLETLFAEKLAIAGLSLSESATRVSAAVQELDLNRPEAVPLLCGWLGLPLPPGHAPLEWSPLKQRQYLYQTIVDVLLRWARGGGLVTIEDLHWSDPSTLECLDLLLKQIGSQPILVLLTARPGTPLSWTVPAPRVLNLSGLDSSDVAELATALIPQSPPNDSDLAQIADRSDGVPLYVEELTMVIGAQQEPGQTTLNDRERPGARGGSLPPSLRDLLTSRLDEIGDAKQTAQFAAALGREFSLKNLETLSEKNDLILLGDLEQLVSAGILVKHLRTDGPGYAFRHALIREAAHDVTPVAERQRIHGRIAVGLEVHFPVLVQSQPDVLANHWELAGNPARAVTGWLKAAQKSMLASAHLEALVQIDRGLALLSELAASPERSVQEADLLLARGATIVAKRGYTDPQSMSSFERVTTLVPPTGETRELAFAARWGLWYFHNAQADLRRSAALADELRAVAVESRDSALSVSAWEAVCEASFCIGRLDAAVQASRSCESEYDFDQHRHLAMVRGDDPLLASLSFEALAELLRGDCDTALARAEQGLALAERLGYPAMRAAMSAQAAWLYLVWGSSGARAPRLGMARHHVKRALDIAAEHGFPFWSLYGGITEACIRIASGEIGALPQLEEGAKYYAAAGAALGRCWHLTFMAQARREQGDYSQAQAALDEAIEFCQTRDSHYFEPEVRRQRAALLIEPRNPDRDLQAGLQELQNAHSCAETYKARWWSLACALDVSRLEVPSALHSSGLAQAIGEVQSRGEPPPLLEEARLVLSTGESAQPEPA
jgi:TOMM system kinase/cyclase fusion protein